MNIKTFKSNYLAGYKDRLTDTVSGSFNRSSVSSVSKISDFTSKLVGFSIAIIFFYYLLRKFAGDVSETLEDINYKNSVKNSLKNKLGSSFYKFEACSNEFTQISLKLKNAFNSFPTRYSTAVEVFSVSNDNTGVKYLISEWVENFGETDTFYIPSSRGIVWFSPSEWLMCLAYAYGTQNTTLIFGKKESLKEAVNSELIGYFGLKDYINSIL